MATGGDDTPGHDNITFYPAFCFKASPTHFAWVKMSAADVHRLRSRKGFEGQNLYFYYNHPIQFVCLAGIVVAREEYPRRTVLVLDDSSGATIEVVVLKAVTTSHESGGATAAPTATAGALPLKDATPETIHVASTTRSPLDVSALTPGAVVKVKGTLSSFRSTMQVVLERFFILPDTNAEIRFWDERTRYLVDVLLVPWSLSAEEIAQLRREAEEEDQREVRDRRRAQEKKKRLAEREEKYRLRIQRRWEQEEKLRERQAAICREANRKFQERMTKRRN
ncbi:hypothetical protein VTN77DRAFT_5627 [Rasamsonia byssochlamydoides]|uniref:uncharacterized protein n=1 Tax=Rasamsonia byssochlamydoides TaxID=89139 RepID=UPI003742DD37